WGRARSRLRLHAHCRKCSRSVVRVSGDLPATSRTNTGSSDALEQLLRFLIVEVRMRVAEQQDVCVCFLECLRAATSRALLLDYDGTLAPFTPDRTRAFPYREIPELISNIMRHETRVVLISGRPATELLFLSGIHPHPEIWGSHGSERLLPDGSYEVDTPA